MRPGKHPARQKNRRRTHSPIDLIEVEPGHRDDLGEQKRGDKAADHVAETTELTTIRKAIGPKGKADKGLDVVLQDQEAGGEAGEGAADRRGDDVDAPRIPTPINGMICRS